MCSSAAPDNSGLNAAALANAELSKEQLEWVKQIYTEGAPDRAEAAARAKEVSDANLASLKQNTELSNEYADYQRNTFRPLEKGIVQSASDYDTEARRDQKAGQAVADVTQQFAATKGQAARDLQRMGVNPSSGRSLAMSSQLGIAQAAASASAAGRARENVETQGFGRKMDAANLGRGLASNPATSAGVALNAGNSAVANGQVPLNIAGNAANSVTNGMSGAGQLNASAGNMYGQSAQIQGQAGASDAAGSAAMGSAIGGIAIAI